MDKNSNKNVLIQGGNAEFSSFKEILEKIIEDYKIMAAQKATFFKVQPVLEKIEALHIAKQQAELSKRITQWNGFVKQYPFLQDMISDKLKGILLGEKQQIAEDWKNKPLFMRCLSHRDRISNRDYITMEILSLGDYWLPNANGVGGRFSTLFVEIEMWGEDANGNIVFQNTLRKPSDLPIGGYNRLFQQAITGILTGNLSSFKGANNSPETDGGAAWPAIPDRHTQNNNWYLVSVAITGIRMLNAAIPFGFITAQPNFVNAAATQVIQGIVNQILGSLTTSGFPTFVTVTPPINDNNGNVLPNAARTALGNVLLVVIQQTFNASGLRAANIAFTVSLAVPPIPNNFDISTD